ncbi:ribosome assembly cofactor RimP [Ornithobacterium rhinotracheale]|uniref:Ribosome maturation factor RimP n=1 Tax=Ornithobacterium rhinotracheale TaxID=28251 RepID=A0A410JU59_ORNRH|nr:ribosome assembly cofactor RimP [Ornithobacterium rhinotracheale]QAR31734.1 ribosome assembly cofactor RimP [Ornithobacterium rhinotracheale]
MKEKVEKLITEAIAENPALFLISWNIDAQNQIQVLVDGDEGLPMEEVVRISRHIEHNLDREAEDFALTVSSPGIDYPLQSPRQFRKNIGRILKVKTENQGEIKARLESVAEDGISLVWKEREKKPVGKGKHTVEKLEKIPFEEIKKAVVQIEI